jgi:hypothetical protein
MFTVDADLHWRSDELKTIGREPLRTDFVQTTTNKNASRVDFVLHADNIPLFD